MAKEKKKKKKKETSAVKYNTSGHYRGRRYNEDLERGVANRLSAHKLNKMDAMDHSIWRKLIKDD